MRPLVVSFALASVAICGPAVAQTGKIDPAVVATMCATLQRTGTPCTGAEWDAQKAAMQTAATTAANASGAPAGQKNWLAAAWQLWKDHVASMPTVPGTNAPAIGPFGWLGRNNWDNIFPKFVGASPFDGGGASGWWDDSLVPCSDYDITIDLAGMIRFPTIPLKTGKELKPWSVSNPAGSPLWRVSLLGDNYASGPQEVFLRYLHKYNTTVPEIQWTGVYSMKYLDSPSVNGKSMTFSTTSKAYWNGSSYVRRSAGTSSPFSFGMSGNAFVDCAAGTTSGTGCRPCPDTSNAGGTFHYYLEGGQRCILYSPNYSLGRIGYYYPDFVSLSVSELTNLAAMGDSILACQLDPAFIKLITNQLWKNAAAQPGYQGNPHTEVADEDVKNDGQQPRIKETADTPNLPATPTPSTPTAPTPTKDDPDEGTDDEDDYGPAPGIPGLPDLTAPEIDWWPDLPTFELGLGSPACPTYPINVPEPFGWEMTLEAHCPILEDNRAAIAVIMILLWTAGAAFIVLRA